MNLKQIELLRTVIDCQTMIKAARVLGMSQPAVSNAVKHLESQLGFALFERINNRLFATPQARALYAESEALFEAWHAFGDRLDAIRSDLHETLRLHATPPLGHGLIPVAMRSFLARHPRVRLRHDIATFGQVSQAVAHGLADLGFVIGAVDETQFHVEPLHEGAMVCVMPGGHPLAAVDIVTPALLRDHALIGLDPATTLGHLLRQAFQAAAVPLAPVVETRYCTTACHMVRQGVGVAVVDVLTATWDTGLEIRPFAPQILVRAQAIHPRSRALGKPARAFLREVQRAVATLPGG